MAKQTPDHERAHYRLRYPPSERPTLICNQAEYELTELSEGGLRFIWKGDQPPGKQQQMCGAIRFHDDERLDIEGVVLRMEDDELVLRLLTTIPLERMMREQRNVLKKFREFYTND